MKSCLLNLKVANVADVPQKYVCVCVCGLLIIGWVVGGFTHLRRCLNPAKDLQQRVSDLVMMMLMKRVSHVSGFINNLPITSIFTLASEEDSHIILQPQHQWSYVFHSVC